MMPTSPDNINAFLKETLRKLDDMKPLTVELDRLRAELAALHDAITIVVKPGDHVLIGVQGVLTARDGHRLAERLHDQHPDVEFTIIDRSPTLAALPEWKCPKCGAVTRARMADH